jgi:hypothetical protein
MRVENPRVDGSIPPLATNFKHLILIDNAYHQVPRSSAKVIEIFLLDTP